MRRQEKKIDLLHAKKDALLREHREQETQKQIEEMLRKKVMKDE